ncbi:MAG TPA: hypothetical protein VMW13_01115 [Dehalococcoidales bacterium]|nr:hypothetical protein [Dehalococcoidales bacterium]
MMEPLRVTKTYKMYEADIMAQVTEDRGVKMWSKFKESGLRKNEFICTPQQWDRLVAWVEWQRRARELVREDDDA